MKKLFLDELNRLSVEEYKQSKKNTVKVVLDNVRSALNTGSAFRTADAFAIEGVYLCGITATPPHRQILKTAIGATESVDWQYFEQTTDAISQLQREGYKVYAIEQANEKIWLQDFKPQSDDKIALVFGNEVKGVDDEVMNLVDGCIEVPQFGTKHSLNVSVCMGVVLWDVIAKMNF